MDADKILVSSGLDILFDGRNKAYGAYNLRKTYKERAILSMFITLILLLVVYLISILSSIHHSDKDNEFLVKDMSLSQIKKEDKLLPPPLPPKLPPPPPKVETIKFTTPKVVKDAEVPNDVKPPEISKIDEAKISTVNQAGEKDMGIVAPPDAPIDSKGTQVVAKPEEQDYVFTKVEKQAEFPGGEMQWRHYLEKNLNPNIPIDDNAPEGTYTVVIRFIVGKDGSIRDVVAETSFGYGMEEEAARVIKNGPKWTPALQNGLNVTAYRRQPITFVIQSQ